MYLLTTLTVSVVGVVCVISIPPDKLFTEKKPLYREKQRRWIGDSAAGVPRVTGEPLCGSFIPVDKTGIFLVCQMVMAALQNNCSKRAQIKKRNPNVLNFLKHYLMVVVELDGYTRNYRGGSGPGQMDRTPERPPAIHVTFPICLSPEKFWKLSTRQIVQAMEKEACNCFQAAGTYCTR